VFAFSVRTTYMGVAAAIGTAALEINTVILNLDLTHRGHKKFTFWY